MPFSIDNKKAMNFAVIIVFSSAFLWDFRPFGHRLLDAIPILFLSAFTIYNFKDIKLRKNDFILLTLISFYCVYGFITFQHKSSIIIGFLFFLFLFNYKLYGKVIYKDIFYIIYIINILLFIFQFLSFHLFNLIVDYHNIIGNDSRIFHVGVFRPSSLNTEPHSYCISVLMLTLLTLNDKRLRLWHHIGSFSMMLSVSLWGLVVGPFISFLVVSYNNMDYFVVIKKFILIISIIIAGFFVTYGILFTEQNTLKETHRRLYYIFDDHSLRERFIKNQDIANHENKIVNNDLEDFKKNESKNINKETSKNKIILNLIFGKGLSTSIFLEGYALNAISFIKVTMGYFGLGLLIFGFYLVWRKLWHLNILTRLLFIAALGLLLTSYPMVTYAYFWIFIAGLIHLLQQINVSGPDDQLSG